ncbi:L,D-transpeptidase [Candidatus Woesearchaeota archaeon]|nr:L,D-transpeptidase [Candidatus Woesearchaeota archaeon]
MRLKEILSIFLTMAVPIGYSYCNQKSLELPIVDEGFYQKYKGKKKEIKEEKKSLLDKEDIWKYEKLEGLEKVLNEHDMYSRIKSIFNENLKLFAGTESMNKKEIERRIESCLDKYVVVSLSKRTLYFFEKDHLKKEYNIIPGNFAPEIYFKNIDDLKEEKVKELISKYSKTPVGVFILKEVKHWPTHRPSRNLVREQEQLFGKQWVEDVYSEDEKGKFIPPGDRHNPLGEYAGRLYGINIKNPEGIYYNIINDEEFKKYKTYIFIHTPWERFQDNLKWFRKKNEKSHGCIRSPELIMSDLHKETQNREKGMFVFIVL